LLAPITAEQAASKGSDELSMRDRLGQVSGSAQCNAQFRLLDDRAHHNRRVSYLWLSAQCFQNALPIKTGHHYIEHDNIGL
jgi:hypothetical protein